MALSTTAWALLAAAALAGAVVSGYLLLRRRPRAVGGVILLLCLIAFTGSLVRYRQVARAERVQRRYYAGLDDKRHGNLEDAERAMREVLALDPGHPDARRELDALSRPAEKAPERQARVQLQPGEGDGVGPKPPQPFHKPSAVGITRYALDVTLSPPTHGLSARAAFTLQARTSVGRIELALSPEFHVDAVAVNGAPVLHTHTRDLLTLETRLRKGSTCDVVVRYTRTAKGPLLNGGDYVGPKGVYLRPESRWYPSTGELDFYAPIQVAARVPRGVTAIGAGRLAGKDVAADTVTYRWQSDEPVRMICLAAGSYVSRYSDVGPVRLETWLAPRHAAKAPAYHAAAARILRFYAERFGAYAYPKLAIAEIPVFPGGYGSTSLLLLTERSFDEKGVPVAFLAHEIAHQWWGNHVAPQGMGAGWLSEAFAEYSSVLYGEHAGGTEARRRALKGLAGHYLSAQSRGAEQAIADADPYAQFGAYEGVIYYKGAYVLHSLRQVMGNGTFSRLLRAFAGRHGGRRASIADFEALAEEIHGRPLKWFFDQWLRRPGAPRLSYAVATHGGETTLTVTQKGEPYQGQMDVVIADAGGKTRHVLNLQGAETVLRVPARGEVSSVAFDPDLWWLQYAPRWVSR